MRPKCCWGPQICLRGQRLCCLRSIWRKWCGRPGQSGGISRKSRAGCFENIVFNATVSQAMGGDRLPLCLLHTHEIFVAVRSNSNRLQLGRNQLIPISCGLSNRGYREPRCQRSEPSVIPKNLQTTWMHSPTMFAFWLFEERLSGDYWWHCRNKISTSRLLWKY